MLVKAGEQATQEDVLQMAAVIFNRKGAEII